MESLIRLERLEPRMQLAVDIVEVGSAVEFSQVGGGELGIDSTTGAITLVGTETIGTNANEFPKSRSPEAIAVASSTEISREEDHRTLDGEPLLF